MLLAEAANDAGTLAPVVKAAGWLISAAVAIGATWRRRAKWEPAEEDVSKGPGRVGGLLCAVALALIWTLLGSKAHLGALAIIAIVLAVVCLVALLGYGYLIACYVYERVVSKATNTSETQKIIGGFELKPAARGQLAEREDLTIQMLLAGAAYNPDLVWTTPSRAKAKMAFVLAYLGVTVCGTLALSTAAMVLIVT